MTLTGAEDEVETLEWLTRAKISPMVGEPDGPPIHYAQYAPPRARDLLVQAGFYLSRLSFRLGVPADLPDMIGGQSLAERSMEMRGPGETVPLVLWIETQVPMPTPLGCSGRCLGFDGRAQPLLHSWGHCLDRAAGAATTDEYGAVLPRSGPNGQPVERSQLEHLRVRAMPVGVRSLNSKPSRTGIRPSLDSEAPQTRPAPSRSSRTCVSSFMLSSTSARRASGSSVCLRNCSRPAAMAGPGPASIMPLAGCGKAESEGPDSGAGENTAISTRRSKRRRAVPLALRPAFQGLPRSFDPQAGHSSVLIRTRLYAACVNVNIHPTRSTPRCFVLRVGPTVLPHPNTCSMRLRFRWLTA